MSRVILSLVAASFWTLAALAQVPAARKPPVPVEPVAAILEALEAHPLVALSEPHTNEQAYQLRLRLLREPRFAELVNDIVVEAGNARYQDVMDRFIRGENVPDAALRLGAMDSALFMQAGSRYLMRDGMRLGRMQLVGQPEFDLTRRCTPAR